MKPIAPIAGTAVSMFVLGLACASAIILNSLTSFGVFLAVAGAVSGAFIWWWRLLLEDDKPARAAFPLAYAMPQDVEALLDQHGQSVNAFLDAARMSMDVEGRLRDGMRALAATQAAIEAELEQYRAEADKVQEIKRVASAAPPRPPRTNPDDYGVRKRAAEDAVPDGFPEFLLAVNRLGGETARSADSWPASAQPAGQPAG